MRFGEIIKKAWHITWHYRFLWVLGVFAGITGGGTGGGGGGSNFRSMSNGSTNGSPFDSSTFTPEMIRTFLQQWLPVIIVGSVLLVVIWIALAVISIGARGGLVWAVNEIEEGRRPRLGQAWNAGFARFWSLLGLGLIIQLPIFIALLALLAVILVPLAGPLLRGDTPEPGAVLVPICGSLAIGLPILIIASLVLSILYIMSTRFIMLEGVGTVHAIGESWRAFRARFGDHALMFLTNVGLNLVASFALLVPVAIVAFVVAVPAAIAGASGHWGAFVVVVAVLVVMAIVASFVFTAIWGTFTSALWTIFYRRLTGREPLSAQMPPAVPAPYAAAPPAPPTAPTMPAVPLMASAPPMAPEGFAYPSQPPSPPSPHAPAAPPSEPSMPADHQDPPANGQ